MKEICGVCKEKIAIWVYMPASSDKNPFYCDDCVPRGCNCNHRYTDINAYDTSLDNLDHPQPHDEPIKWIEKDKIWCHVDEKNREYPCCEFFYEEEGFDKDDILEE